MKTLLTRALTAVIAASFVALLVYFGGKGGLQLLGLIAVLLSIREGTRLLFPAGVSGILKGVFAVLTLALFLVGVLAFDSLISAFGVATVLFFSMTLFFRDDFTDLDLLSRFQNRALLGFFYLAFLPIYAMKILDLEHGSVWFIALLAFVFAGDTGAYLIGSKFGKRLLMPSISPKKSVEGSMGGLLGSGLAALVFHFFLPHVSIFPLVALALAVGLVGQMGDFFESMLKRVANRKDSGSLMPGHGGVLDRIDGVLFAAPLMFAGASLLEKWF